MLEFPDSMKQFASKNVYMVAATLRAETMYGQTNCYVLPEGEYGVYEMVNDEYFVMSARAARNFAFQDLTKEYAKYPCLAKVTGMDLIGKALRAPLTTYEKVYALPMTTISMVKGTGIVTSVPSDSPDDWAALRDLQTKAGLREKYNVKEEWCVPFEPVPIINIPEFGDLSAVFLVDDLKIQSQKDKDLLKQAKDRAYLKGFYEGKMLVGIAEGQTVEKAKPLVKQHMLDAGLAVPYYEPEGEIISRTGDTCIVASCYQWFLKYGEDEWREFVREHLVSDGFKAYNTKTQHEFEIIIDWLKEWGCTRTQGLGTTLPWDESFVIESLSDSTIYMAYYTVAHLLQGGVLDGSQPGPLGIKAEDMNSGCWDFIFKKGQYPENCKVSHEHLSMMRHEFEYWYPMDLRVSGKDLIRNHLTMSLYNHAAMWEDHAMMPRSFYCNGYMVLNNEKMSKSTGNFLTVRDCIDKFGVDATRITLADAGDGLDDANFDTDVANATILKLFTLEKWISDNLKSTIPDGSIDFTSHR
jgi:leucyl-tRNA synthetase